MLFVLPMSLEAQQVNCRNDYKGVICTDQNGTEWLKREDHKGRTIWHDRVSGNILREEPRRNGAQYRDPSTQRVVGRTERSSGGRTWWETIDGKRQLCRTNNLGETHCS